MNHNNNDNQNSTELEITVNCLVCASPINQNDTTYCQRCDTPHHQDCWEYNKGCAVYGCKQPELETQIINSKKTNLPIKINEPLSLKEKLIYGASVISTMSYILYLIS
ncbi:MAG: RING finger protein [Nanoarchaeota archaeon]|nr:RING finger protein [Nanoarchaeota archaeon]